VLIYIALFDPPRIPNAFLTSNILEWNPNLHFHSTERYESKNSNSAQRAMWSEQNLSLGNQ
jgi:hypothetical protein